MSANTGRPPRRATAPAVAKKVNGVVTTSSPGRSSSAISSTSRASVPELSPMAWPTPAARATSASSASTSGPWM